MFGGLRRGSDEHVCRFPERSWQRSSVCAPSTRRRARPAPRRAAPTRRCWLSFACSGKHLLCSGPAGETYRADIRKQVCPRLGRVVCRSVVWQRGGGVVVLHRGRALYSRWRRQIADFGRVQHRNPFQRVCKIFPKGNFNKQKRNSVHV